MLKDLISNYKYGIYKTAKDVMESVAYDVANEIDNDLIELEENVKSGRFSNEEIAERISELRKIIYG